MRFATHALTRSLAVLVAVLLAAPSFAAAAQATTSQPVGSETIAFTSDWVYSDSSSPDIACLVYQAPGQVPGPEADYFYLELDNSTLAMLDNQYVIEAVMMPTLRDSLQYGVTPLIAQGDLSAPTLWTLYSVDTAAGPTVLLIVANTSLIPGMTAVAWIMASPQNFAQVLTAAQQEITISGQPNVMSLVDANTILTAASSPQATTAQTQQPAPRQTTQQQPAAPTPATGQTSAPPSTSGQAGIVAVGNDAVTFGVDWQYLPDDSNDTGAVFQERSNTQVLYLYYFSPDGSMDAATALQQYDQEFYGDLDPSTVQALTTETLPSGAAWSLHRIDDADGSAVYLTMVNVSPQGTRYQILESPPDLLATSLPAAQQEFTINDTAAFVGLDPAYASSFVSGAPIAQAPQTGAAAPAGGQTANVASMDAPTGCDGIGWVVTDPSQLPATQADVDHDSACVGGAAYIAACGTYSVADADTIVECEVTVVVGSTPMAIASPQFALVDASGTAYPVDTDTTTVMSALLGVQGLPEGTVAADTTATGMIFFTIPAPASQPWTLQVTPDTIATTGEQPGVLVIDGQLQPFTVFQQ